MRELGVKRKKTDFRKGEWNQSVETDLPSGSGGGQVELVLKPSYPCGFPFAGSRGVSMFPLTLIDLFLNIYFQI